MIKAFLALSLMTLLGCAAIAQEYRPKQGETDMRIVIEGKGVVWIQLHTKEAPRTTSRIIELVNQRFYDGQKFYRVIKSPKPFLIQTGDPASKERDAGDKSLGTGGTGVFIPFEDSGYGNVKGAVGLSSLPTDRDKGDCQFYVLLDDQPFLNGNYTVFGQVVSGMNVVQNVELGDRISTVTIVRG